MITEAIYIFGKYEFYARYQNEDNIVRKLNYTIGDKVKSIRDVKYELYVKSCEYCGSLDLWRGYKSDSTREEYHKISEFDICGSCEKTGKSIIRRAYPRWRWRP